MEIKEALEKILSNSKNPSLNYAINYASWGLKLLMHTGQDEAFRVQMLYLSCNLSHWRQNKDYSITKEEISTIRKLVKQKGL